jgi:hypothetical protein
MLSIDRWRQLPAARRGLLPAALVAVALMRLCLRFLPLRAWEIATDRRLRNRRPPSASAHATGQDVAWAVRRVSHVVPGATCLTQALAAQLLLSRRGYASRLRIGVARAPGDRLRAHAWLESDGVVVLGGFGVEAYTPLGTTANAEDLVAGEVGEASNTVRRPLRPSLN